MTEFFEHIIMDICNSREQERIQALRGIELDGLKAWCEEQLELDGVPSSSRFRFTFLREMFNWSSDESAKLWDFIQDKTAYALDINEPSAAEPQKTECFYCDKTFANPNIHIASAHRQILDDARFDKRIPVPPGFVRGDEIFKTTMRTGRFASS
jgi:hypothetical protein